MVSLDSTFIDHNIERESGFQKEVFKMKLVMRSFEIIIETALCL